MVSALHALNNSLESITMTDILDTIKTDCRQPLQDYSLLTPEEKQRFGYIVHQLRKQGMSLKLAQEMAYSRVLCEDIPFGEPKGMT